MSPPAALPQPLYGAAISVYTSQGRAPVMKASVLFYGVCMLGTPCCFLWASVSAWEEVHCLRASWKGRRLSFPFPGLGQALEAPLLGGGRGMQEAAEPMAGVRESAAALGPVL